VNPDIAVKTSIQLDSETVNLLNVDVTFGVTQGVTPGWPLSPS
jgi:hypothetical protein